MIIKFGGGEGGQRRCPPSPYQKLSFLHRYFYVQRCIDKIHLFLTCGEWKQLAFCYEYMIDKNPIFAYIRAGYLGRGKVAEKESSRLLKLTKIQTKLQELKAQESSQVLNLQRRVVKEFEKIAFSRSPNLIENFGEGSNDNNLQAAIRVLQVTDITLSMHAINLSKTRCC